MALLLVVILQILPLFTRAMTVNLGGSEATQSSHAALTRAEDLLRMPFNSDTASADLVPASGEDTAESRDFMDLLSRRWSPNTPTNRRLWTRTARVQQFNVSDLLDADGELTQPLDGGVEPGTVHLKQIEVVLEPGRKGIGATAGGGRYVIRTLRAF